MGKDHLGNTYYEDFGTDYKLNRRWVEYADHIIHFGKTGDAVPPAWDGWLKHTYSDVPGEGNHFHTPFYSKSYYGSHHNDSKAHCPPGFIGIHNK